jgi:hypothetical protein
MSKNNDEWIFYVEKAPWANKLKNEWFGVLKLLCKSSSS